MEMVRQRRSQTGEKQVPWVRECHTAVDWTKWEGPDLGMAHPLSLTNSTSSGALAYTKPASELKSIVDMVLSIFYTVVPPSVNPIIYSLRNKDIKRINA
ncbi:Olfactory receptor 14A16 [Manis javanica]|nr:Olfactory receptor 14A16 [Manis javanica]